MYIHTFIVLTMYSTYTYIAVDKIITLIHRVIRLDSLRTNRHRINDDGDEDYAEYKKRTSAHSSLLCRYIQNEIRPLLLLFHVHVYNQSSSMVSLFIFTIMQRISARLYR